ncbi:MAG: hypothetical protein ACI4W2_03750 [Eubacterium sp.]
MFERIIIGKERYLNFLKKNMKNNRNKRDNTKGSEQEMTASELANQENADSDKVRIKEKDKTGIPLSEDDRFDRTDHPLQDIILPDEMGKYIEQDVRG